MDSTETKLCVRCNVLKPTGDFYKNPRNTGPEGKGYHSYCKTCFKECQWASDLVRDYGVTREWYFATLVAQGGGCVICRTIDPGGKSERFCVDHNHETGQVRGLLCHDCNTGLGKFRDNPSLLRAALAYLLPDIQPAVDDWMI